MIEPVTFIHISEYINKFKLMPYTEIKITLSEANSVRLPTGIIHDIRFDNCVNIEKIVLMVNGLIVEEILVEENNIYEKFLCTNLAGFACHQLDLFSKDKNKLSKCDVTYNKINILNKDLRIFDYHVYYYNKQGKRIITSDGTSFFAGNILSFPMIFKEPQEIKTKLVCRKTSKKLLAQYIDKYREHIYFDVNVVGIIHDFLENKDWRKTNLYRDNIPEWLKDCNFFS